MVDCCLVQLDDKKVEKIHFGNVKSAFCFRVIFAARDFFTVDCWRVPGKSYLSPISHPVEDCEGDTPTKDSTIPGDYHIIQKEK